MSIWYYTNEKGERIKISGGQLKGLAKAGLITPETIVETENGVKAPAKKVKGLTFAVPTPPVESEIYGITAPPPKPSPFTAAIPTAEVMSVTDPSAVANPFSAPMPLVAKSADSPFSASMPATHQVELQSAPVSGWAVCAGYAALISPIMVFMPFFTPVSFIIASVIMYFVGSRLMKQ